MKNDFISEYHNLLAAGDPRAEWAQFLEAMEAQALRFGERYICNVLRPLLLERTHFKQVLRASSHFFAAIDTMYEWLMEDATLRARMGLSDYEEAALHIEPGFPSPDGIGRLDGFLDTQGKLRFVEYNADSPGGLGFGHALGALFMELPTMQRFAKRHPVTIMPAMDDVLDCLLAHYRLWGGKKVFPTIGIVDWEGLGTAPEFILFRNHFEKAGYSSVITHPRALMLKDGRLWDEKSGKVIDIVYKRVLVGELLERLGLENILTQAMRERAACIVNSYRAQLIFKKALFALLSELADDARFPIVQQQAIQNHLPWTRIVREQYVDYNGQQVDLVPYLGEHQEQFVLKPNSEYGGRGVMLGWESNADVWQQALKNAAHSASHEPWVVQERIHLATQSFPLLHDGTLILEERYMDLDPYLYAPGRVCGAGVRLGASGLLNVTAGGGSAVPLVLVES